MHRSESKAPLTPFLGILDYIKRRSIFDASAGILELGLAEDVAAGLFRQTFEPYL